MNLTKQEIGALLLIINSSSFKGSEVELVVTLKNKLIKENGKTK